MGETAAWMDEWMDELASSKSNDDLAEHAMIQPKTS